MTKVSYSQKELTLTDQEYNMGTITFTDALPDPNNQIGDGGQGGEGSTGAGFKTVTLESKTPVMRTRTNSGSVITRSRASHTWTANISYNPLTRAAFEPVDNFLLQRQTSLKPFLISLPQNRVPQDSTFAAYLLTTDTTIVPTADLVSGVTQMTITNSGGTAYNSTTKGTCKPGDMFTITDTSNTNHTKMYKVTRIETNAKYEGSTQPTTAQQRIHFIPPLAKSVDASETTLRLYNPYMRVIQKGDVQSYSLDSKGLYKFSLKVEEAQP